MGEVGWRWCEGVLGEVKWAEVTRRLHTHWRTWVKEFSPRLITFFGGTGSQPGLRRRHEHLLWKPIIPNQRFLPFISNESLLAFIHNNHILHSLEWIEGNPTIVFVLGYCLTLRENENRIDRAPGGLKTFLPNWHLTETSWQIISVEINLSCWGYFREKSIDFVEIPLP